MIARRDRVPVEREVRAQGLVILQQCSAVVYPHYRERDYRAYIKRPCWPLAHHRTSIKHTCCLKKQKITFSCQVPVAIISIKQSYSLTMSAANDALQIISHLGVFLACNERSVIDVKNVVFIAVSASKLHQHHCCCCL
jgi:hypothetical protein